ncbi:MAG: ATP synthase F0 subunit B [Candidatus Eremiobacteraeota bacterium]|nr:ATP synthase F0 subunit B [Candidatus Eremiobacteraeota bacterium]MBV8373814.1 ATP synthase F0 subunit B [Candidatus Eremiobacteraeota bacterium]
MNQDAFYIQVAIWSQVISAALFMGVLLWLWFKFIQPAILAAQERYNKQIAEAERHRDEAKATLDVLHNEIDGAAHDAELIRARAEAQATHEYDATIAEAREAGERAVANANGEFDRALAAARDRLRVDLLDKALERARREAARRVDAALNAKLVDRFVGSLERSNG